MNGNTFHTIHDFCELNLGGEKMSNFPKFYGKVPVGTKGQIVIPMEARKAMKIKPGDNVMIISGPPHQEKMISVIPEDEFSKFLKFFEEHVSNLKKAVLEQEKKK
jgi:AbrB family looped-hinge helix DNA binding protein